MKSPQHAAYHRQVSSADEDDSDGKPEERSIPPTRRHESVPEPKAGTRFEVPFGVGLGGALILIGLMVTAIAFLKQNHSFASAFNGVSCVRARVMDSNHTLETRSPLSIRHIFEVFQ